MTSANRCCCPQEMCLEEILVQTGMVVCCQLIRPSSAPGPRPHRSCYFLLPEPPALLQRRPAPTARNLLAPRSPCLRIPSGAFSRLSLRPSAARSRPCPRPRPLSSSSRSPHQAFSSCTVSSSQSSQTSRPHAPRSSCSARPRISSISGPCRCLSTRRVGPVLPQRSPCQSWSRPSTRSFASLPC